jgi:glucokinase
MSYVIGIDLGGSSVKAVAVTTAGEALARINSDFDSTERMAWAEKVQACVHQIQNERGGPALSVGVSAPGLASADGRSISYLPGRLHGLEGLNWTEQLHTAKPVPVLNDAHAALLGEVWLGAARGFQNVILLTLGTGVGGAAMVDGRLLRGRIGRAGHLGHISLGPDGSPSICGTPGSLEVAIGNCTIQERSSGRFQTTHDLIAAHLAGDADASAIWLRSVNALARAVCSFVNILDPEAVIIGGGIARAGGALFEPLQRFLDPIEWRPGGHRVKLLPAQLGEFAGAYGAAYNALECQVEHSSEPGSSRGNEAQIPQSSKPRR